MHKKTLSLISIISIMSLASCGGNSSFSFPSHSVSGIPNPYSTSIVSESEGGENASQVTSGGGTVISTENGGEVVSKTEVSSSKEAESSVEIPEEEGDRKFSIYAINDFHGQIQESKQLNQIGAAKLFSFLKKENEKGNTLLCNQGDLFQGSLESNYNRGHLLNDLMNYAGFDCMTLGNHEFDWSQSAITVNKDVTYESQYTGTYKTPYLAANIYDFNIDTLKVGTNQQSTLGQEYTVSTLENGLKVGIIGVIGTDQITSITSQYVDDLTFIDPIKTVKTLSDKLRTEENVDVVIASVHSGTDTTSSLPSVNQSTLSSVSTVSGKKYCDVVLTAHTHSSDYEEVNGVPYMQSYCNGREIGNLEFTVTKDGEVRYDSHRSLGYNDVSSTTVDSKIKSMIEYYGQESGVIGIKKLATMSGSWDASNHIPNILAESLYKEARKEGYEVDFAVVNKARAAISPGQLTYSGLFNAVPFDNEVMIIETKGEDLIKEAGYNFVYRGIGDAVDANATYKIAVIDYLATHRGTSRKYNYFPGMNLLGSLEIDGEKYLYREVLADYLKTQTTWENADFTNNQPRFNKTLSNAVTL